MINVVVLSGRLATDIELRKTKSDKALAKFTLAVYENENKTNFINCMAWEYNANKLSQSRKKGECVTLVGSWQTDKYDNADGKRVYVNYLLVNRVDLNGQTKKSDNQDDTYDLPATPDVTETDLPF